GNDVARTDGVRANAVRRSLGAEELGDGDHAGLRDRVGGDLVHGANAGVGGDVDHRARALFAHRLEARPRDPEERCQVHLEELSEDALRSGLDRPLEDDAGARDEYVQPAAAELERPLDRPVRRCAVAVVAGKERRVRVARDGLPALTAAACERNRHSLGAQAPDARPPDSRRSTGDECAPAFEVELDGHLGSAWGGTPPALSEARMPPSTSRIEPLQNAPSVDAKKVTAPATSAPVPTRASGGSVQLAGSPASSRPPTYVAMPGAVSPGQTAFTRIPCGPASTARVCTSMFTARFETE